MDVRRVHKHFGAAALGCVLIAASGGTVIAGEPTLVTVTNVTFERNATLCGELATSACVRVSGTMTCDAAGPAEWVEVVLTQRGVTGQDNLDLLDFACSTEPRAFRVAAETFTCEVEFTGRREGCFRPGLATVQAVKDGVVIAEETVLIRKE